MKRILPNTCGRLASILMLLFGMLLSASAETYYVNGIEYGMDKDGNVYVYGLQNKSEFTGPLHIPATVTLNGVDYPVAYIEDEAFKNVERIESVTIEEGLWAIGGGAFQGCSGLRSVSLPSTLTTMFNYVFSNCDGLTSVTIPDNVTTMGDYTFYNCDNLEEVTLGVNLVLKGQYNFQYCPKLHTLNINCKTLPDWACRELTSLMHVNFGPEVETIGSRCFNGCTLLEEIVLPASVKSVGDNAFRACTALKSVKVMGSQTVIADKSFLETALETVYTNQETVTGFVSCTNLTTVTFGDDARKIGKNAFWKCSGLVNIDLPSQITSIGYSSFQSCTALETITMKSVTYIDAYAFFKCSNLVQVKFSDNLETIYESAFEYCTSLGYLTFPKSLRKVKDYAFRNSELRGAIFQEGVTTFGAAALNSSQLEELELPSTVTSIGNSFMMGNQGLKKLTVHWTTPPEGSNRNWFGYYDATLYVPEGSEENYKNTIPWKYFTIETIPVSSELEAKVAISDLASKDGEFFHDATDVTCDITLQNLTANAYAGRILVKLVEWTPLTSTYVDEQEFTSVPIDGNGTATLQHVFPADKMEVGKSYFVEAYYNRLNNMEACGTSSTWKCVAASSFIKGDANGDKEVDVADVVAIVNKILEKPSDTFNFEAADVNGDDTIDVGDVVGVVNIILKGGE